MGPFAWRRADMVRGLLVSHGQPSDPDIGEAEIAALAAAVGPDVRGVTLAADGALQAAVAAAPDAPIVPVFMSDGWFTRVALPRRLGGQGGARLAPMGTWPELVDLAADWLTAEVAARGWTVADTTLIVLGHGSGRSPFAALDTRIFVDRLARRLTFAALRCGFVEQAPYLAEALAGADAKTLCLPFFAAKRGHVLDDIPEALAETRFPGVLLDPIGLNDRVPGMIARALDRQQEATQNDDGGHTG